MFLYLFIIGYTTTRTAQSYLPIFIFPDFGLYKGGSFYYKIITNYLNDTIFVGLITQIEETSVWNSSLDYKEVCKSHNIHLSAINYTMRPFIEHTHEFIVDNEDTYQPIFVSCNHSNINLTVFIRFTNPGTFLDSRWTKSLFVLPFLIIIPIGVIVLYILFVSSRKILFIPLHFFILLTLLTNAVAALLKIVDLVLLSKSSSTMLPLGYVAGILNEQMLYSTVILAASGYQLTRTDFKFLPVLISLVTALIYSVGEYMKSQVITHENLITVFLVQLVCFVLFIKQFADAIRHTEIYLLSYEMVVEASGYIVETTPIHKKFLMVYQLLCSALVYFLLRLTHLICETFIDLPNWAVDVTKRCIDNLLMICLIFIFMPFKVTRVDWNSTLDEELLLEKCEERDFDETFARRCDILQDWENGNELPCPPIVLPLKYLNRKPDSEQRETPLLDEVLP